MAGQYSHKQFFRRVPHLQLADYFKTKEVDLGIDFKELKEKDVDALFDAFVQGRIIPRNILQQLSDGCALDLYRLRAIHGVA